MADTLESLEIEVKHSSSGAAEAIRAVTSAISAMGDELSRVLPQLKEYAETLRTLASTPVPSTPSLPQSPELPPTNPRPQSVLDPEDVEAANNAFQRLKEILAGIGNLAGRALGVLHEDVVGLARGLGNLATVAITARAAMQSTGNAAKKASGSVRNLANETKSLSRAAKKSQGPLATFINGLKRIAFYRILRSIIKEITEAFDDDLKNAYAFSQGITTETHRFSVAMDSMSSAGLKMKNQLGAAFISLLSAIMPIILKLIELITMLANALTQLFAAFTGGTYLRARDVFQSWGETAEEGAEDTKEWKNQLMGFDELNRLEAPSDTSSGTGNNELSPMDMFEEVEIDGIFKKIRDAIKDLIDSIDFGPLQEAWERLKTAAKELAETIGVALKWAWDNVLVPLAHWTLEKLAPKLVELLAAALELLNAVLKRLGPILEPLWENVLKPFFQWCGEMVLTGLEKLIDLLEDLTALVSGEITWEEFINGLDGVQIALLALGGVLVLDAIAKVTAAIFSIPATVVAAVPTLAANLAAMAKAALVGATAVFDAVMVAYDAKTLADAAETYEGAQEAHNNETETALTSYANLYNTKGKEVADAWANMVYQIDTTNMTFDEAQKALTEKIESYWDGVPQNMWEGFKGGWDEYFGEDGKGLAQLLTDAFDSAVDGVRDMLGIHSPSEVFEDIGTNMVQGLEDGFDKKWDSFENLAKDLVYSLVEIIINAINDAISQATDNIKTMVTQAKSILSTLSVEAQGNIDKIVSSSQETLNRIVSEVQEALNKLISQAQATLNNIKAKSYATGGFPEDGLFYANHGELVGQFSNGKTAVANNEQIIAGIKQGVYEAVASAMNGRSGGDDGNITVYIGDEAVYSGYTKWNKRQQLITGGRT